MDKGKIENRGQVFQTRLMLLFLGFVLGFVLAFILNVAWYLFRLIVLGYGHSAPESFIKLDEWVERVLVIVSILFCLIASQWYYHHAHKKGKL